MKNVFTIQPSKPFVDVLAGWILETWGDDPLALARVRVLLPTRRATRALQDAFLKISKGKPLVLPRMDAIGGMDREELSLLEPTALASGEGQLSAKPAMDKFERLALLTRLVLAAGKKLVPRPGADQLDLSFPQALRLAQGLAQLLDQAETEGVDLKGLSAPTIEADLARHWEDSKQFLQILSHLWPDIIAERGLVSAATERRNLMEQQVALWKEQPPETPIIAAGSTGSIPSTRMLLKAVTELDQGYLVLPGLDSLMSEAAWESVTSDETHPQFNLRNLIEFCAINRKDIRLLAGSDEASDRFSLLSNATLPAAQTGAWRDLSKGSFSQALDGLVKVETRDANAEAQAVAILMRETLEEKGKTAALITPDRNLARRVIIEMRRWGVELDDSAGLPLKNTDAGLLFRLTADALAKDFSPAALLAVLKHPFAQIVEDHADNKALLYQFERLVLRGEKPQAGAEGLKHKILASQTGDRTAERWTDELRNFADVLINTLSVDDGLKPFNQHLNQHLQLLDMLDRQQNIWRGEQGESLAVFLENLDQAFGDTTLEIDAKAYADCLEALILAETVRQPYGLHPRLFIWGTMEGRLQQTDRIILGGLNEGTWPTQTDVGPWLSRSMRRELELPTPERKIGLSSHDFVQACCAKEVFITRALKSGTSETRASRLIQRMDTVVQKLGLSYDAAKANQIKALVAKLDQPEKTELEPIAQPSFAPPVALRPKTLSITDYELLLRDPYAVYAKKVLKLAQLDPIEHNLSLADRGNTIHDLLDAFVREYPSGPLPRNAESTLMDQGRKAFLKLHQTAPGATAFWWPRYRRIIQWFVKQETKRRTTPQNSLVEIKGEQVFVGLKIEGRADRVDQLSDGTLEIIDYKTGTAPTGKQVTDLKSPQLLLEALLAEANGFKDLPVKSDVSQIAFWKLTGSGSEPAKIIPINNAKGALDQAKKDLIQQIGEQADQLADPEHAFVALPDPLMAPRYQAYAILERESEWRATSEDAEVAHEA